ncbi:MAG: type II secretion system protein N [Rhodoferax sp.]|nr:type II secretion system protein N [Rhodoferax sp.]
MQNHSHSIWWLRIATFSVAALAAASATFWVLKWTAAAPVGPSAAVNFAGPSQADPQVVARLLGGGQTGIAAAQAVTIDTAASRFKLTGVVADRAKGGYALISVDGKPARPYRVGTLVDNALVLQSVAPRSAALAASADAPVSIILDLPKMAQP